jgi:regulator of protease activity HflC (stomatin/prohibitin superfamily)
VASFWVVIPAGERGVWMRFGQVQEEILAEGLHFLIPLVDSVETLSTRVQIARLTTCCDPEITYWFSRLVELV